MKWVRRAFALAMVAGGILMGCYAGTELAAVTGSFQWELAVAWWFIGLLAGALLLTLDIVLSHLQPVESPSTEKAKRSMEKIIIILKDLLNINKDKVIMENKKVYPVHFGTKRRGFTKRESPKSKTM
ncbi:hypothetical protein ABD76_03555 [Paenibacillus dendritiformis]|uniref:hypothetical protein n=1 Tax=Paenibacillus dendritiformis TaxID=130049 RepID=UPI0018CE2D81|nr:hypothetical protein [Paenibacillus dendritiformis]MBG9791635.1 hypothetical protein [Paenibacillus dendritiformis]